MCVNTICLHIFANYVIEVHIKSYTHTHTHGGSEREIDKETEKKTN